MASNRSPKITLWYDVRPHRRPREHRASSSLLTLYEAHSRAREKALLLMIKRFLLPLPRVLGTNGWEGAPDEDDGEDDGAAEAGRPRGGFLWRPWLSSPNHPQAGRRPSDRLTAKSSDIATLQACNFISCHALKRMNDTLFIMHPVSPQAASLPRLVS